MYGRASIQCLFSIRDFGLHFHKWFLSLASSVFKIRKVLQPLYHLFGVDHLRSLFCKELCCCLPHCPIFLLFAMEC
jgi:hypothetical protein